MFLIQSHLPVHTYPSTPAHPQILTQVDASGRDLPFPLKVGGVELFPYLFWGTIASAVIWGSKTLFENVSGKKSSTGRWVYDRSLGGKKVRAAEYKN